MTTEWKPTFRFTLVSQDAPRVQASLFALEPRTEPPCEHCETQEQMTFAGELVTVCCACGRSL